ncbi:hypothetical protein [Kitasatospora sp. NPDC047058]|uniref:hypothetical protein n=1 Tax=Kitasatospora sp. NPDC047058 TaxID=3155620 RepID=UPI0033D9DB8E
MLLELVDQRRSEVGLSWWALARELGVTSSAWARMKRGRAPDAHLLLSLLIWLEWAPELALLAEPVGAQR